MADDSVGLVNEGFKQIESSLARFNTRLREAVGDDGVFVKFDKLIGSAATGMLKATGLAAGLLGVAKALESVAAAGVQLQDLSRNSGYAVKSVTDLQGAMRLMGASAQEANRTVANIGDKMQSLAVFKEGSDIWQGMAKFPGAGAAIANTLMEIAKGGMKTGDQMGATLKMLELFRKQSPETKYVWAQMWGESVSTLDQLERKLRVAQELAIPQFSREEHEHYLELLVGWELKIEAVWDRVGLHGIEGINKIGEAFAHEGVTMKGVIDGLNSFVDKGLNTISQDIKDITAIIEAFGHAQEYWERVKDNAAKATGTERSDKYDSMHKPWDVDDIPGAPERSNKYNPNHPAWNVRDIPGAPGPMDGFLKWWSGGRYGKRSDAGTSDATDFSGRRRTDDIVEVEKDSSKTLIDIRDILQRMEVTGDDDRSGGSYASSGGGRASLGRRLGIHKGSGATSGGGGGGGHGISGGGSGGGGGSDGGGDGSTPAGSGPRSSGLKTNQREVARIMEEEWTNAGMSKAGIAGIMANVQDESRFNPTLRHADQPKFSGEAHYAHGLYQEGGTEWNNYAAWLKQNYPDADWQDPRLQSRFAAERLKAAYPRTWRKMNEAKSGGEAGAAYVNEYLKPAAGYRYSRMNKYNRGVPDVDYYTGGKQPTESMNTIDEQRSSMDRAQATLANRGAFVNAKVEFLNVPPGVKTSAGETEGFHELQISRTRQGGVYNQPIGYE